MDEVTCFIMDNLFGKDFMNIDRIYDLKGSTKGRRAKLTPNEEQGIEGTGLKVLKDLNYIDFGEKLKIAERQKEELMSTIEKDSTFLMRNNLMDFSLLLIKARHVTE